MTDIAQSLTTSGALHQSGEIRQAESECRKILAAEPNHAEAGNRLGRVLIAQGRLDEAVEALRHVIRVRPDFADAYSGLGLALRLQGLHNEALEQLATALQFNPDHAEAGNSLGRVLIALGRLDEAVEAFRHVLSVRPEFADVYSGLGLALRLQGLYDEALASYDRAIELRPEFAQVHFSRSQIWLSQGDLARGWREYEWRLACPNTSVPRLSQPRWDGSRLDGRTILLYAEQGFGDTMQFIRYVPLVQRLGPQVLVGVQPALVPLLQHSGIQNLFSGVADVSHVHVHSPLLSLPGVFRTTLDSIPSDVPYLHADPSLVERWRPAVERFAGFRVGISWQGSPTHKFDRYRSLRLVEFLPIAKVPGVQLISLQRIHGTEQIGELGERFNVAKLADERGPAADDWMETAAIMRNLDLVITCDSAVAHLAGALGVPVWVTLPVHPDWRWLLDRDDSPWYPTMRLFRQTRLGDWSDVFERIAAELSHRSFTPSIPKRQRRARG